MVQLISKSEHYQNCSLFAPVDGKIDIVDGVAFVSEECAELLLQNRAIWTTPEAEEEEARKTEEALKTKNQAIKEAKEKGTSISESLDDETRKLLAETDFLHCPMEELITVAETLQIKNWQGLQKKEKALRIYIANNVKQLLTAKPKKEEQGDPEESNTETQE